MQNKRKLLKIAKNWVKKKLEQILSEAWKPLDDDKKGHTLW